MRRSLDVNDDDHARRRREGIFPDWPTAITYMVVLGALSGLILYFGYRLITG